ncbi:MAG: hypothetical protein DHS20C14_16450 [Phycisphaeraceae bacterium]|nr:MAG: hypothetical protein DHS20C14_16450 [Phycisphaeraceae bacterium]
MTIGVAIAGKVFFAGFYEFFPQFPIITTEESPPLDPNAGRAQMICNVAIVLGVVFTAWCILRLRRVVENQKYEDRNS